MLLIKRYLKLLFWITFYSIVQCTLILMTNTLDLEDLRVTPLMERVATNLPQVP